MLNDGERDGGYGFAQRHRDEERRRDKPAFSQRKIHKKFQTLTYFLTFILWFGCGQNRVSGGELLHSSLHRGDTLGVRLWYFHY